VPYVLMADKNDVLHKAIVADELVGEARRCRELWLGLQERVPAARGKPRDPREPGLDELVARAEPFL